MKTKNLTLMAILVAIGVLGAQFLWFPTGTARAFPVQHAINVITAVLLGPGPAIVVAFLIGLVRNMLGLGSLLAFPGGMLGALLAGFFYRFFRRKGAAAVGEMIGTGVLGSLLSVPIANLLMGQKAGALAFVPGFLASSITGALLGWLIIRRLKIPQQRQ
ncbi:energy coupling factor transporter S component ThiW [Terribacillus saccharophilus]|uniref:energy coupling factor transporter S component ThiW n=1 Tax=Terribacillus saccharophilus TaxID=361277 RepID=UPI000BA66925|nr:energy coupling factor transporter S component ThiW [Terribacillus saccharophilus]PAF17318.1 energy coupling factor transporter S component ThiW [Terribacillus saccharophilus]PAF35515.1 energy coupling factor transporter S component ThiW [Terribacillus saccharophilus]